MKAVSAETNTIIKRIQDYRRDHEEAIPTQGELLSLFDNKEQTNIYLSAYEVSRILTAVAGREISQDYVKRLRLDERLPYAKQVSDRAYIFRLRDVLSVQFRAHYRTRPTGRPVKQK